MCRALFNRRRHQGNGDIITRTIICQTWNGNPMESIMVPNNLREDKIPERPVLNFHKWGITSQLAKTCTQKTKINEVQVMEEVQNTKEKEESNQNAAIYGNTLVEDYPIENIVTFFEVT
ncbi:hypothetical protein O181_078752 [Austropuccinia psidii MF-1]|uniref:Uncharacterized protein n=1 Tax=Austropuccinia psidii MF-1 TaxID=1389203 RepID=A0A9Q3IFV8_9BASI|nr:hypothetical protein [Austropuccinia psidii MF-1]